MTILSFLLFACFSLSIAYALLLSVLYKAWSVGKQKKRTQPQSTTFPFISIVVPARNEADTIGNCLISLLKQDYPLSLMEVLVIDDFSNDGTAETVKAFSDERIRFLRLAEIKSTTSGKKAALEAGISRSKGELIVTTDADCEVNPLWLQSIVIAWQRKARMILGPVKMTGHNTLIHAWQGLDVCGTMLLTGATVQMGYPILANGANFAFSKACFYDLGGYAGNRQEASGDDVFLLQKAVKKEVESIEFLFHENAVISTEAESDWTTLFWQRLRWAGKTSAYKEPILVLFQAFVYFLNGALLLGGILSFFIPLIAKAVIGSWLIKLTADYLFLRYACQQVGDSVWLRWFLPVQLLHTVYIFLIGTLALLPLTYYWKGRKLR